MAASGSGDPAEEARQLARYAFLAMAGAAAALLTALGGGLLILLSGIAGLAATAVGVWWFLAHRGPLRVSGALLAVAAPLTTLGLYVVGGVWVNALVALGLWGLALSCARSALRPLRRRSGPR
ncbi:hypothetical protein STANM309S_00555 [Streptomyces tanashiensis]